MRTSQAGQTHVCLSCLLRHGPSTRSAFNAQVGANITRTRGSEHAYTTASQTVPRTPSRNVRTTVTTPKTIRRLNTSSSTEPVRLNSTQIGYLGRLHHFKEKLRGGLSQVPKKEAKPEQVRIEELLAAVKPQLQQTDDEFVRTIGRVYAGKSFDEVVQDLSVVGKHRRASLGAVKDENAIQILDKLGCMPSKNSKHQPWDTKEATANSEPKTKKKRSKISKITSLSIRKQYGVVLRKAKTTSAQLATPPKPASRARTEASSNPGRITRVLSRERPRSSNEALPRVIQAPANAKSVDGASIAQKPVEEEATLPVPKLSFDLSRVLFNPGVYHLQDPRSRVYNFDPYLEKIMPVSDFNFQALNPYITSSEDDHLRNVSMKHRKRYIGSSSSMSGAMSHFHFLLSAWRPLDMSMLSQRMDGTQNFTLITKAPSGIFLRWRDGVYAVDADKEHDTPNILMMQGKSMEKLLTLEKEDFEKYRKRKAGEEAPAINSDPESYHYSGCENFLLRSQLDAWDPRLPGTGMFDLKTRACAGIRMDMGNHEQGMGYQIKGRFGAWESFDREYFDMMRSAFLKYSLQVRMGRMDGIFVAYHNIERIFGFQYISLAELDAGLHGQTDPCLGDQEFKVTVKLMNEVFDLATEAYPEQSLRFVFETREPTKTHPNGFMRIFAEPMSEEKIQSIQKAGKARVEEYEKNMAAGDELATGDNMGGQSIESKLSPSTLESNSADVAFLEEMFGQRQSAVVDPITSTKPGPVACWTLNVYNEVNGKATTRPHDIKSSDGWTVRYDIERVAEPEARGLYSSCQHRRAVALSWNVEARKDSVFIERIRKLSQEGRSWRDEQDNLDAQRDKVVLYESAETGPNP